MINWNRCFWSFLCVLQNQSNWISFQYLIGSQELCKVELNWNIWAKTERFSHERFVFVQEIIILLVSKICCFEKFCFQSRQNHQLGVWQDESDKFEFEVGWQMRVSDDTFFWCLLVDYLFVSDFFMMLASWYVYIILMEWIIYWTVLDFYTCTIFCFRSLIISVAKCPLMRKILVRVIFRMILLILMTFLWVCATGIRLAR